MIGPQMLFSRLTAFVSRYYRHPAYQPLWQKLNGHAIQIGIQGFGDWVLDIVDGQLEIITLDGTASEPAPTITITGPLKAYLRLASTRDLPEAKQLGLCITGDLTLALSLAQIFKNPPIDFTERLSGWIGDNAAVRLTRWGSKLYHHVKQGPRQMADMTTEYLQEEALLLPTAMEVEDWMLAVDTLRDDVERLAARINLLNTTAQHTHAK